MGVSVVESHYRSIAKGITCRTGGTIVTDFVAWILTGNISLATGIRVSVGIEDFEDIKNDFQQAIKKACEEIR